MPLRSDQKALLFIGAVAVLGAGVRVVRAATGRRDPGPQPALERQSRAADSASRAGRQKGKRVAGKLSDAKSRSPKGTSAPVGSGPLDRPGYVAGKLDLDVATATQIDSLPGVGPAMAKRIVADRMRRGPFVTRDGLRRVKGTGPTFLAKIDSFVMFSGTVKHPEASDTIIPKSTRKR
jgi:competence protein ComEA